MCFVVEKQVLLGNKKMAGGDHLMRGMLHIEEVSKGGYYRSVFVVYAVKNHVVQYESFHAF